jgi:Spy/CpxP family protein refolding chaperone
MKKFFLLAIVAIVSASVAIAQEQKTAEVKTDKQTDQKAQPSRSEEIDKMITAELKLTEAQLEKYNALKKEFSEKKEAIAKDASLSNDVKKEKKGALMKEKETMFLSLLTPEQQAKYTERRAEIEKKLAAPKQ